MQLNEVMSELEAMGNEKTCHMFRNHGADGPMFGVKIGDMKKLVKKIKKDQPLAEQLFDTGNLDAQYFAGQIADPQTISPEVLEHWAHSAQFYMVAEYAVAGVAADSPHGWELGLKWIEDPSPVVQCIGWSTLAGVVAVLPDEQLDTARLAELLERVRTTIHDCENRVRYCMNGFAISLGAYVKNLYEKVLQAGNQVGKVKVDMGGTACKVPFLPDYLEKIQAMGRVGQKKKTARC